MSEQVDVSIVIISYNTRDFIVPCLRSLYQETTEVSFEVIVLDNQSDDGSCDAIESEFPQVRLIRHDANAGFARGNNIAAEQARGRRILLLNPDTLILDHAIDRLVAFADENPSNRIWGGKHLFGDRSLNTHNCWGDYSLWTVFLVAFALPTVFPNSALFNPRGYPKYDRSTVYQVDAITGCYLLIDTDLWNQLEGFAEEFFMFAEEVDLCRRARDLGAQPLITPESVIVHYGGGSTPIRSEDRSVQLLKAERQYFKKHFGAVQAPIATALQDLRILLRSGLTGFMRLFRKRSESNFYAKLWRRRAEWA